MYRIEMIELMYGPIEKEVVSDETVVPVEEQNYPFPLDPDNPGLEEVMLEVRGSKRIIFNPGSCAI